MGIFDDASNVQNTTNIFNVNPNTPMKDPNYLGSRINYSDPNLPLDIRYARNRDREPGSFVTSVLDLLGRGQYFSATLTDGLLSKGFTALPEALYNAFSEGLNPQARLSFEDILKRYGGDFAKDNPWTAWTLGLAGDIFLDPTTYIGVGLVGKGKRVGQAVLTSAGEELFNKALTMETARIAQQFGKASSDDFVRKASATFFRANESLIASKNAQSIVTNVLKGGEEATKKLAELGLENLIGKELVKEKGLRITVGLGKRSTEIEAYRYLNPIFDALGLNEVKGKIADLGSMIGEKGKTIPILGKGIEKVQELGKSGIELKNKLKGLFVVDDETKDLFRYYENNITNYETDIIQDIAQIKEFKNADLKKTMDAQLELEKVIETTKNYRGYLDQKEIADISQDVFTKNGLNVEERVLVSKLMQRSNDIAFVRYGVDMLTEGVRNYDDGIKTIVSSADDYLNYKNALLTGTAGKFVAENKELQNKIFSLENVGQMLGKQNVKILGDQIKDDLGKVIGIKEETIKFGEKVTKVDDKFLENLNFERFNKNDKSIFAKNLKKEGAITTTVGTDDDLQTLASGLVNSGFKYSTPFNKLGSEGNDLLGFVTDGSKAFDQFVFNNKDGSIIRLLREETGATIQLPVGNGKYGRKTEYKYTLIKSVAAPNEEFAKRFVGESKLDRLSLEEIKANKNVVNGVLVDPFGNSTRSLYNGAEYNATYQALKEAGKDIDVNALTLYAQRAMIAQKQLGKSTFDDALKITFGVESKKDLPQKIQDRLAYLGEGLYGGGLKEGSKALLQAIDSATGLFKKSATVYRPSFAVKQTIQNPLQASLVYGLDAFKVFDPRSVLEGAITVFTRNNVNVPDFVKNLFVSANEDKKLASLTMDFLSAQNDFDILEKLVVSDTLGRKMNGLELRDAMQSLGVLKGSIDDLSTIERDGLKEVSKLTGGEQSGAVSFFKESLKYWKWPKHIEDFYRAAYFINGVRSGQTLEESAKLVDKALFNYQGNLTEFERRVVKRLVPFYSYQRNAIPLVLDTLFSSGGAKTGATFYKAGNAFYDVWNKLQGGQQLSDDERYISPNFIFEQASVYAGRDKEGNLTYNTFNSFNPFEAIGLVGQDENGKFDFEATLKKIVLTSLSPYVKMSVEIPNNRYFFNDRVLTEATKFNSLGYYLDATLPKSVKDMIRFESVTDPVSGKDKYYINPYIAYFMSTLAPGVNDITRFVDPEKTVSERVLSLITGVQTYKYNKSELEQTKVLKTKFRISELKGEYMKAIKQGRPNEAERRLGELKNYFDFMVKESSYRSVDK